MSNFDPDLFMQMEVQDAGSTEYLKIPESDEGYPAVIKKVEGKTINFFDKETGEPQSFPAVEITWEVDSEKVREYMGQPHPQIRQMLFLEFNDKNMLDMGKGKNVELNRIRDALGQNVPGWKFSNLENAVAKIMVRHKKDEKSGDYFARVSGVTSLKKKAA